MAWNTLLVPLDGSPFGEQALPLAVSIARRAGAALELAHVHAPFEFYQAPSTVAPGLDEKARQDKRAYLDGVLGRVAAAAGVPVTAALLVGKPADALHDHAVARRIGLVVMATHGRGPLSRFWLGSVADDLVRRLPMPLLLVRPQEPGPEAGQEPVCQRLLIPLDGSELAEQVLPPAVALGALMQAQYTLLRVVDPLLTLDETALIRVKTRLCSASLYAETAILRERQQAEAQNYLEMVAHRLRCQSLAVQVRVVEHAHHATAILDAARTQGSDLIALATQGLGGLARLLLGSVADKVVRGATIPVLVCRPRGQ